MMKSKLNLIFLVSALCMGCDQNSQKAAYAKKEFHLEIVNNYLSGMPDTSGAIVGSIFFRKL